MNRLDVEEVLFVPEEEGKADGVKDEVDEDDDPEEEEVDGGDADSCTDSGLVS